MTTIRKRWTWTDWTQDDAGAGYIINPRVTETRVGDGTNTKRTTVQYLNYPLTSIAQFGLASSTSVYDTNLTTELKRVETEFIKPGRPMQKGFIERFNRIYRQAILDMYIFESLDQVRELTARWIDFYNRRRPHDSLGGKPPSESSEQQSLTS